MKEDPTLEEDIYEFKKSTRELFDPIMVWIIYHPKIFKTACIGIIVLNVICLIVSMIRNVL